MSTPIMGSPPSPVLQPERPTRSISPDNWTLSSPNASEMPSPLRRSLGPMLSLAREAKEESYADLTPRDTRPPAPLPQDDVSLSRRSSSKARSSPASPPQSRTTQGYRKYHSPRVETDSEPEEGVGIPARTTWRTPTVERLEPSEEPRSPPPPQPQYAPSSVRMGSPRRSTTKSRSSKRNSGSSVAQRRLLDMSGGQSSDSGFGPSPLCHSPLVSLPLPDIP